MSRDIVNKGFTVVSSMAMENEPVARTWIQQAKQTRA